MRHTPSDSTLDRIIRPRALADRLGVSATTLWRMRQRGDLPEPISISTGAKGWREGDIASWLAARAEGR